MDAIIGKYKVRMEDNRLIITHTVGISFDFTHEEALGMCSFIDIYRQSFKEDRDTDAYLQSITLLQEEAKEHA